MCRSIKPLRRRETETTTGEIEAAAQTAVRSSVGPDVDLIIAHLRELLQAELRRSHPEEIAYFNIIAGGPEKGARWRRSSSGAPSFR